MGAQQPLLLLLPGLAAFALLFWVNRQLAARFRRRFNVGIVAAAAAIAVLTLVAVVVSQGQRSANQDLRDGPYKDAVDAASARTAGNDAKANESLRLIKRGSGQVYEDAWAAADRKVRNTTSADAAWARYEAVHREIVRLDTNGRWDRRGRPRHHDRRPRVDGSLRRRSTRSPGRPSPTPASPPPTSSARATREFWSLLP